jgi:uncharacterized protein with beta-barrel porin domain
MIKKTLKTKFTKILFLIFPFFLYSFASYGATFDTVGDVNLSNSSISDGNILNFSRTNNDTLSVDASKTLDSVTTANDGIGIINFTSNNILKITNDIGTAAENISQITFDSNEGTLDMGGNVYIQSGISTDTNNKGSLIFSGNASQTINPTIGASSLSLNKISISNNSSDGVSFNDDVFINDIDFTNSSGTSTISIATAKTIDLIGDISQTNSDASSVIKGDGTLKLSGSASQTIDSQLGTSTSDRLRALDITNGSTVFLNKDSYITSSTFGVASTLNIGSILDISTTNINENLAITGSGTASLGITSIADDKSLTLGVNSTIGELSMVNASSNLIINTGKITNFTDDIVGTGIIKGDADTKGNITFSGSSAQYIDSAIEVGQSANRLNKLSVSNIHANGVTFHNDVFATGLDFTNSLDTSTISIATAKTIDLIGDISQTNPDASSVIKGDGTLKLSGSASQTIDSQLGTSTSDRLGALEINNSAGVTLNQDSYLTTLTLTSNIVNIAGDKTLDATDAIDLSGKTLNSSIASSAFGKIKSGGNITIDNSTNINFDYSNNKVTLDSNGATQYTIAEVSEINEIIGDVTVTVSDNSFLFDNSLSISGNNIVTTIANSSNFSEASLGSKSYKIINNALNHTNASSGVFSLSTNIETRQAIKNLQPLNAFNQEMLNISDNIANITTLRLRNIDNNKYKNELWVKILGGVSNQKEVSDEGKKYNSNFGGILFGIDRSINKNILLGGAISYNRVNIEGDDNSNDKNNINSYQLTIYNKNQNNINSFYNENIISGSFNQYQTQRDIIIGSFSEKVNGKFDGTSYFAKSSFGYNAKLLSNSNLSLTPNFAIKYFNSTQDDYEETGSTTARLKLAKQDYSNLFSEIGIKLGNNFIYEGYQFSPKISLSWSKKINDDKDQKSLISFVGGGEEMESQTITIKDNQFDVGLEMKISDIGYNQSFDIRGDLKLADGFIGGLFSLEYKKSF